VPAPESEHDLATLAGEVAKPDTTPAPPSKARPLARGDVVGRYVVLERLGVGGMGEVYAAYDPELDRKIAIKLLLPGQGDSLGTSSGHGRLLREAQAMAKLHHPNVVAVHDVGTYDVRVFVAMEFVDGGNLADWIEDGSDGKGKPHPWPEVLGRFLAAGEGLAAAHAAGLIHRDFKPANVLVGQDGSVRVADFGLARQAVLDSPSEPRVEPTASGKPDLISDATLPALEHSFGGGKSIRASLSMRMTVTGATLGTPAYMAPEQYSHTEIDARADQFSFCVALWEALYGDRPYAGDNLHALMFAINQGNLREPPSGSDVPASLRRALVRGLDRDPQRRWPDMQSLLVELRFDPHTRRRTWALSAAGLGLLGALSWGVLASRPEPRAEPPVCAGAAAALGDAFTSERREAIATHFAKLEQQWAHDVGERLLPRLDAWTQEWQAAWTDACEDTHVRVEQSTELLDRRLLCLDRQRRGFIKLVDALASADEPLARKADTLLAELGSIEACSDSDELLRMTPMPDDPERAKAIIAADQVLSDAQGLYFAGEIEEAKALLDSQSTIVSELDYPPLSATFEQLRGRLAMFQDDPAGGEQALERAFAWAIEAGDDRRATRIARSLALELRERERNTEAARWLLIGGAIAERLDDDALRGEIEIAHSQVLASAGDYPGAETAAIAAYELLRQARPDDAIVGDALYLMGLASYRAGRYDEATQRIEQARSAWGPTIGPRHPRTVAGLGVLGISARSKGDYAAAEKHFREAMAIEQDSYGADHVQATTHMMNLAVVLADQGKLDEAIALVERVIAIRRATPDAGGGWTGRTLINLAEMQRKAGRFEEAAKNLDEGEALFRANLGDDHPDLIVGIHIRALVELARGNLDDAERHIQDCLGRAERQHGADNSMLFELRTDAAKVALARGKPKLAAERLQGSVAAETSPRFLGEREFVQAQVHAALGREVEAIEAAERAKQEFERDGPGSARALAEVEAWLKERG
jgi:serine/threonine protein kinase/tetratricopeptide (TPR) repeat protein